MVEEAVEHERDPRVQGEVINAMHDVCDLNANSSLSLNDHESMLNGDQKRVYDSVKEISSHCVNLSVELVVQGNHSLLKPSRSWL